MPTVPIFATLLCYPEVVPMSLPPKPILLAVRERPLSLEQHNREHAEGPVIEGPLTKEPARLTVFKPKEKDKCENNAITFFCGRGQIAKTSYLFKCTAASRASLPVLSALMKAIRAFL